MLEQANGERTQSALAYSLKAALAAGTVQLYFLPRRAARREESCNLSRLPI